MTGPFGVIVDAGPALAFLAGKTTTRALFQGIRGLSERPGFLSTETVRREVLAVCGKKPKLEPAAKRWVTLENSKRITVLPDDETAELSAAVQRLVRAPMAERMKSPRDLGELMVVAHASVLAENGNDVTVLIEDGGGAALARREAARLANGSPKAGRLRIWGTEDVLLRAIGSPEIPNKATMKSLYNAMRPLDDALVPIERTSLLTSPRWNPLNSGPP